MDISEFEYLTTDMEVTIKTFKFILSKLDNDLNNYYAYLIENNCIKIFDELRAYKFIFDMLSETFNNFQKKYQEQIELHYNKD